MAEVIEKDMVAVELGKRGRTPRAKDVRAPHKPEEIFAAESATAIKAKDIAPAVAEKVVNTTVVMQAAPVENRVIYKTYPLHDAMLQVISTDDTPKMRAEKLRAMADAADAHLRLMEMGVRHNDFLLLNEPDVSKIKIENGAVVIQGEKEKRGVGEERKSGKGKKIFMLGFTLLVIAGLVGVGIWYWKTKM